MGLTPAPVIHQILETPWVRAYNEVLGGELQPKVGLLQGMEAKWAEEPCSEEEEEEELVEEGTVGRVPCSLLAGH